MASPLSLDVGYHFGEFQCLPVDDCPAASCDSGVLTRGSLKIGFYVQFVKYLIVLLSQFLSDIHKVLSSLSH